MNKVMGFIKGNLIVVISVVLILALLPTGYVFSSKWNAKVKAKVNDAYQGEKRTLTASGRVNYAVPAVLEGEQDITESRAPNTTVTKFYEQALAARVQQVEEVVSRGTAFNQGDHVELVPGLLPKAEDVRVLARLGRSMSEAIVGTLDTPSVYQRKLQRLNAGSPPDPQILAQTLDQARATLEQEYRSANADGNLTPEQTTKLTEEMTARRLGEYISRAKSLTFYCSTDAFVNGAPGGENETIDRQGYSIIPAANWTPSQITEGVAYTWLWDYWIISDILDAAALANTNIAAGAMSIPEAPVKRIESIRIAGLEIAAGQSEDDSGTTFSMRPRGMPDDPAPVDGPVSFTGREGGQADSAYDLRTVEVVAVVSSENLPKFLDAIGKVNFMTVTDLDLSSVDIWNEIQQGYYYGQEHVVRVAMTIETVWLRSWMTPLMPDSVKQTLGVPITQSFGDEGG